MVNKDMINKLGNSNPSSSDSETCELSFFPLKEEGFRF